MMFGRGFWGGGSCFMAGEFWGIIALAGFLLIILALAFWATRNRPSGDSRLLSDLKMRYVSGEISEEEYLHKKDILTRK